MDNATNQTKTTPTKAFDASMTKIEEMLVLLQGQLETLKKEQKGQPHRWDIAGEAARIETALTNICIK